MKLSITTAVSIGYLVLEKAEIISMENINMD